MSFTRQNSGIKAVKRDFSSNSQSSSSQSSDAPLTRGLPAAAGAAGTRSLAATQQRLKAIQDALNGVPVAGEKQTSLAGQKRPAPALLDPSTSKRRQLPRSWSQENVDVKVNGSIQSQGMSKTISSTSVNKTSETTITMSSTTKSTAKTAEVFLSSEQKHILKLVEDGESVFYTGSAGA